MRSARPSGEDILVRYLQEWRRAAVAPDLQHLRGAVVPHLDGQADGQRVVYQQTRIAGIFEDEAALAGGNVHADHIEMAPIARIYAKQHLSRIITRCAPDERAHARLLGQRQLLASVEIHAMTAIVLVSVTVAEDDEVTVGVGPEVAGYRPPRFPCDLLRPSDVVQRGNKDIPDTDHWLSPGELSPARTELDVRAVRIAEKRAAGNERDDRPWCRPEMQRHAYPTVKTSAI